MRNGRLLPAETTLQQSKLATLRTHHEQSGGLNAELAERLALTPPEAYDQCWQATLQPCASDDLDRQIGCGQHRNDAEKSTL